MGDFEGKIGWPGHARMCPAVDILKVTQQGAEPVWSDADWGVVDGVHVGAT